MNCRGSPRTFAYRHWPIPQSNRACWMASI
jgi:hypothetical protein